MTTSLDKMLTGERPLLLMISEVAVTQCEKGMREFLVVGVYDKEKCSLYERDIRPEPEGCEILVEDVLHSFML